MRSLKELFIFYSPYLANLVNIFERMLKWNKFREEYRILLAELNYCIC